MNVTDVPTDKIQIGMRHRVDYGDIEGLAANIGEMGLLQPIGIDPFFHLIFGFRRLYACKDLLKWKQIPCVTLDLESLLAGEYAENEFRKDFTVTERVAIGAAIEVELGKRKPGPKSSANAEQLLAGNAVDIAAKGAGFKSAESFERAKTVTMRGAPELKAAVDKGEISISAGADIASQPIKAQKQIVAMPKAERRQVLEQIRQTKAHKEADERRAYDLRVYRGLAESVERIAKYFEDARDTWAGLERVSAFDFADNLDLAIKCLSRIQKEHPNARRPGIVTKTTH